MRATKNKSITCADGFKMSVQADERAYCEPREDDQTYTEVEVGYPSAEESLLMAFAENADKPTETVYGWVPVTVVALVCAKHGGIVDGELPKGVPLFTAIQCGNS